MRKGSKVGLSVAVVVAVAEAAMAVESVSMSMLLSKVSGEMGDPTTGVGMTVWMLCVM